MPQNVEQLKKAIAANIPRLPDGSRGFRTRLQIEGEEREIWSAEQDLDDVMYYGNSWYVVDVPFYMKWDPTR